VSSSQLMLTWQMKAIGRSLDSLHPLAGNTEIYLTCASLFRLIFRIQHNYTYVLTAHLATRPRVGIATKESGFDSRQVQDTFLLYTAYLPALGTTQPPIQWVPRVKRQGREADHSLPSSAEVLNSETIPALPRTSS
jgi:hypothetical protein